MARLVETIDLSSDEDESVPSPDVPLITQSKPVCKTFVVDSSGKIVNEISVPSPDVPLITQSKPVCKTFVVDGSGKVFNEISDQSSISSSSAVQSPCLSPSHSSSSSTKEKKGGVSFRSHQFEKASSRKRKHDNNLARKRIKPSICPATPGIQNGSSMSSPASSEMRNGELTTNEIDDILSKENPLQSFIDVMKLLSDKVNEYIHERSINVLNEKVSNCDASFLISENFKRLVEENIEHMNLYIDGIQGCRFRLVDELHNSRANNNSDRPRRLKQLTVTESRTSLKNSGRSLLPDSNSRTLIVSDTSISTSITPMSPSDNFNQTLSSSENNRMLHVAQTARKSFPSPSNFPSDHSTGKDAIQETPEEKEKRKRIAKLDKLLLKIVKRIRELRQQEISSSDDENSAYIREDRMCKKMVSVCKMLWKENSARFLTGRPIERKIHYQSTRYPEVNERVERLVNKMKLFPDYQDILQLVTKTNDEFDLGISAIPDLARDIFKEIGVKLQKQRIETYLQHLSEMVEDEEENEKYEDISDESILKKLEESNEEREKKIAEIIKRYAEMDSKTFEQGTSKEKSNGDIEEEYNVENDDDNENEYDDMENEESNDEDNISAAESEDIEILDDEVSVELD